MLGIGGSIERTRQINERGLRMIMGLPTEVTICQASRDINEMNIQRT